PGSPSAETGSRHGGREKGRDEMKSSAVGYRAAAVLVMTILAASGALAASPIQEGTLVHLADGDVGAGSTAGRARDPRHRFPAPPFGAPRGGPRPRGGWSCRNGSSTHRSPTVCAHSHCTDRSRTAVVEPQPGGVSGPGCQRA